MTLQVIVHSLPDASPFNEVQDHLGRAPSLPASILLSGIKGLSFEELHHKDY